jgi:hypothetical protein
LVSVAERGVAWCTDLAVGGFQAFGQFGDLAVQPLVTVIRSVEPVLQRREDGGLLPGPGRWLKVVP